MAGLKQASAAIRADDRGGTEAAPSLHRFGSATVSTAWIMPFDRVTFGIVTSMASFFSPRADGFVAFSAPTAASHFAAGNLK
jgi:hypothetical protein